VGEKLRRHDLLVDVAARASVEGWHCVLENDASEAASLQVTTARSVAVTRLITEDTLAMDGLQLHDTYCATVLVLQGNCGVAMHCDVPSAESPEAGRLILCGHLLMRNEVARLA